MTCSKDYRALYRDEIKKQIRLNQEHLQSLKHPGTQLNFEVDPSELPDPDQARKVFFFDIDNTLYRKSTKVQLLMQRSLSNFFKYELGFEEDEAERLIESYYEEYGLSVKGLIENKQIDDVLQYNTFIDDSLPLQDYLKPDWKLRELLINLKKKRFGKFDKLWLCTNSYKNHAIRCVKILGIADLFDGITYCHYDRPIDEEFICKPDPRFFETAKLQSGLATFANAWFIDDNESNVEAALTVGMGHVIHLIEDYQYDSENIVTKDHSNKQQFSILKDILEIPLVMRRNTFYPSSFAIKEREDAEEESEAVNWSKHQINVQSS
ncbi:hypothetical protein SEUBUCD646_0E01200 [Saccharomyces eubayanus]|uniref:Bifunctional nucleotidase/lysophosphatidic acid phosphatase n=1 Tax=Saccharomyces pastorianus TaxID=27292 RepID=A0A6C1E7P0_SACPS|nr:bifunctional nucleotidase/lysophosphatidic acid phosphatase [Saccharomyces pastorianus]CAI1979159.1 hypothetical protein SEUBUCD646_0E01200 [Saccharomyces eubayanus]